MTSAGFTDREVHRKTAPVHMNGLVYDPVLGRMISADPTVPDPAYSQAYNRYMYVYGNPLSMEDPSGFSPAKTKCATSGCQKCVEDCIPSDDGTNTAETGSHIPGVHTGATCGGDCGLAGPAAVIKGTQDIVQLPGFVRFAGKVQTHDTQLTSCSRATSADFPALQHDFVQVLA